MPTDTIDWNNANALMERIRNGAELHIQNHLHHWKIDANLLARWAKAGNVPLKTSKGGKLLMASGRKWVDVSLCARTLV